MLCVFVFPHTGCMGGAGRRGRVGGNRLFLLMRICDKIENSTKMEGSVAEEVSVSAVGVCARACVCTCV